MSDSAIDLLVHLAKTLDDYETAAIGTALSVGQHLDLARSTIYALQGLTQQWRRQGDRVAVYRLLAIRKLLMGPVTNEGMEGCVDIINLAAVVLRRPLFVWHEASGRLYAMRRLAG